MARVSFITAAGLAAKALPADEELARRLDCSQGTVRGLINDTWTSIDRRILERLLDELSANLRGFLK